MISAPDIQIWYSDNGFSEEAQRLIEYIRQSEPSRRVRSTAKSVAGAYPSLKMGVTIQFESHKNELCFIREFYEFSDEVLEYYDQPPSIKLNYKSKDGKNLGILHTPDFFVLRKVNAGWEECKTEEQLIKLTEKSPSRYQLIDGIWRSLPAEEYAESFGLYYHIRLSTEINLKKQRNIIFLEDFYRTDVSPIPDAVRLEILSIVNSNTGILLRDLISEIKPASSDNIYKMIVSDELYVDLNNSILSEINDVRVYTSKIRSEIDSQNCSLHDTDYRVVLLKINIGDTIIWDGKACKILNIGETDVYLQGDDDKVNWIPIEQFEKLVKEKKISGLIEENETDISKKRREIYKRAGKKAQAVAETKFALIAPCLKGAKPSGTQAHVRKIYRLLKRYREDKTIYGDGFLGLLPQQKNKGNRNRRVSADLLSLVEESIKKDFEDKGEGRDKSDIKSDVKSKAGRARNIRSAYGAFVERLKGTGIAPISYATYCKEVKKRPEHEQIRNRFGARAAYASEPFYSELYQNTPRHGDRPFEICHIDHTELDIELVESENRKCLGRPWLTIATDAYSRRLLAISLSYDPPSYRSCMLVIREIVRRYSRFPQIIVVDGGKEFSSTYFDVLLARYECTKKIRPAAKARFGSVCERLFGTANTQLVHNLIGNTKIMKNVRQVTKSVNPRNLAIWTLEALYSVVSRWAYEVYDSIIHPALGQSPKDAFAAGMINAGDRLHRMVQYNDDFHFMTLPTTAKGYAKIVPNRGIKIQHIFYWAEQFRNLEGIKVDVRYDPYNIGEAYAFVDGEWVTCISEYYPSLRGKSERQVKIATAEIRRRKSVHASSSNFQVTTKMLAEFLSSVDDCEEYLLQVARDNESIKVNARCNTENDQRLSNTNKDNENDSDKKETDKKVKDTFVLTPNELEIYEEY